jgi:hypothetical protein
MAIPSVYVNLAVKSLSMRANHWLAKYHPRVVAEGRVIPSQRLL